MNLLTQHEQAMNLSFLAKQARYFGNEDKCLEYYSQAAKLESEIADYYMDKPEFEPTRSIIIRSAAFLNLKAGIIEGAEKFIFWGIINSQDKIIRDQLYEALDLCVSYRDLTSREISGNVDYIYKLRQKSIFYSIEPKSHQYSTAVSLEMISDFSNNYTKSLKAFSGSRYRDHFTNDNTSLQQQEKEVSEFQELINPMLTTARFGSFKFSIASDFLQRVGESEDFTRLKSNILIKYHDEVFTKDLTDENIDQLKSEFTNEEIDQIFRPLLNIKSNKADYSVSYIDRDSLKKVYLPNAKNIQKQKLLPKKEISVEDIGQLENIISHTRVNQKGIFSRSTILKQELKAYSFDHRTDYLETKKHQPLILKEEIIINIDFNSQLGFTFSFEDLPVETTSITYTEGLIEFYDNLIDFIKNNLQLKEKNDLESQFWLVIKRIIENPESII